LGGPATCWWATSTTAPPPTTLWVPRIRTIANEVDLSFGDSGGPSFYGGEIIGVHDLIGCFSTSDSSPCFVPPSLSTIDDSYFGQIFGDTSVPADASWIESAEAPEPASCSLVLLGLQ